MHIGTVGGENDDCKQSFVRAAAAILRWSGDPPIFTAASHWSAFSTDVEVGMIQTGLVSCKRVGGLVRERGVQ